MAWKLSEWLDASGHDQAEEYLVRAIRAHLLSEEHRKMLYDRNLSVEDVLNGRVEGEDQDVVYQALFDDWNGKLGWKEFGSSGLSRPKE